MVDSRESGQTTNSSRRSELGSQGVPERQSAVMQRLANWLDKQLVPILRRRTFKRLEGDIHAYESGLQGRVKSDALLPED